MSPVQRCFRILNLVSLFALAYGLPGWAEDLAIGVVEPQKVLDGTTAGKQEKSTLVMEKGDAGLGALIMYSEPSINLTDRVIKAFEGKGARREPDPPPRSQPQSYTPPPPPANTPAPRGTWRPWVH